MEPAERLRVYSALADTTRRWVSVMDAKAAFLSALNCPVITFVWSGAKLTSTSNLAVLCGTAATVTALLGLVIALWVVAPRQSIEAVFGRTVSWSNKYKPFSFYAFIASTYRPSEFDTLASELDQ